MKKQIFSLLTVGALMLSMGAAAEQEPLTFKAGTYESRQFGMGGYFNVQVTFSDHAIESISAPDNKETKMVGTEAIRILSDRIIDNSNGAKDPVQVAMVAYHGQELIDYYATLGVYFNEKKVNATDGSKVNRGHALTPNIGTAVSTMANLLTERGVDVRYGTKAVGLITDENGAVIGVQATDYYGEPVSYYGNHIVLASGGWGDNNEMIVTYWGKDYDGLVYGGSKGMDGAMLNAAVSLGADLVDMNDAHIDATLEVTRGITITTNVLRNCGGILVRQKTGERFADELHAPFYVLKVSNGVACTTGGLRIDDQLRVLDTQGNPIDQLYAIGEITGGYRVHYVGGDSLSHSGISGMLVAEELTK